MLRDMTLKLFQWPVRKKLQTVRMGIRMRMLITHRTIEIRFRYPEKAIGNGCPFLFILPAGLIRCWGVSVLVVDNNAVRLRNLKET
jgi:hypothetical protein